MRIMTGDKDGALVALQRSLVATQTRRLGAERPTTLGERGNLGNMLNDSGKPADALPIAEAVAEARARVLGADDPQTPRQSSNLSSILARLKPSTNRSRCRRAGRRGPHPPARAGAPGTRCSSNSTRGATPVPGRAGEGRAGAAERILPLARCKVLGDKQLQVRTWTTSAPVAADELGDHAPSPRTASC